MLEIHSPNSRRRFAARPVAVAVAALALAAGGLSGCGDAGATITRLTVGSPGPDPYTLASNTDEMKVKKRPRAGGTQDGDSPGLYGGTRRAAACDQRKLIAFLQANPEKARAWAKVQGIPVSDIPRYVSRLTPVLLRTDTLVTNHGYRDGEATRSPAVLQAGMGVLVNGYGVPAVKCNCGNPLTRPEKKISPRNASYSGRSWPGFEKRNVTKIRPRDTRKGTIENYVLVDPEGTMGFERPRATAGPADGPPVELPATETEVPTGDSPAPEDSGLESPGIRSPGVQSPGVESPGPESPGTGTEGPQTTEPGAPGTGPATGEPGVPTVGPGTETGGLETPGDVPQAPISLPPETPEAEPTPSVT